MKHWGLQYKKRLQDFSAVFAGTKCELSDASADVVQAQRKVVHANRASAEVAIRHEANIRALKVLMEMGPTGLASIEGESGPEMSVTDFLAALDRVGSRQAQAENSALSRQIETQVDDNKGDTA